MLDKVQEQSIHQLNSSVRKMLLEVNNVLFEHLKKVTEYSDKTLFTDSMNKLREGHEDIQSDFIRQMGSNFSKLQEIVTQEKTNVLKKLSSSSLKLVHHDELEENIAIDVMVAKSNAANKVVLSQIEARFDNLITDKSVDSSNNPLNPRTICQAFQQAITPLALDIKPKLVVYKLFERLVVSKFTDIYKDINNQLISSGILPELVKTTAIKRVESIREKVQPETNNDENDTGTDVLVALKEILTNYNSKKSYNSVNTAHHNSIPSNIVMPQQFIDQNTLIQALSTAQLENQILKSANNSEVPVVDIRNQIGTILSTPEPLSSHSIGQANDNVIDIISMLFDFILDDQNLPDEFKVLIGRLQIPVLKVALIDESFLSEGSHPARKLINEMGLAGIGWTEEFGTGLRDLVAKIVNRIIKEFKDDTSIFTEELAKFQEFSRSQQKRVSLIEKRIQETEEGKAKRQTAEIIAKATIKEIVGNNQLPEPVEKLMLEDWVNVMQMTYLREGDGTETWNQHLKTGTDLIASLIPVMTNESRERLEKNLPEIIENIKIGLDVISNDEFDNNQLFNELENIHKLVLNGQSVLSQLDKPSDSDGDENNNINADLDIKTKQSDELESNLPLIEELILDTDSFEILNADSIQNFTSGNTPPSIHVEPEIDIELKIDIEPEIDIEFDTTSTTDDEKYLTTVENIQAGSWFKIKQQGEAEKKEIHCKLAAIISSLGKYIFVNHSGRKVAEYTKIQLVESIKNKQISQLEEGVLFERALRSIVTNFRTQKYKTDGMWS